jgi:hypothetical protein
MVFDVDATFETPSDIEAATFQQFIFPVVSDSIA